MKDGEKEKRVFGKKRKGSDRVWAAWDHLFSLEKGEGSLTNSGRGLDRRELLQSVTGGMVKN